MVFFWDLGVVWGCGRFCRGGRGFGLNSLSRSIGWLFRICMQAHAAQATRLHIYTSLPLPADEKVHRTFPVHFCQELFSGSKSFMGFYGSGDLEDWIQGFDCS